MMFRYLNLLFHHEIFHISSHWLMETYRILKFRQPRSLYDGNNISEQKPTLLIAGFPSQSFTVTVVNLGLECDHTQA